MMKKRFAALILALILIAAAALPALGQTVVDELAAYWEKADPIYAQIQALGDRQAEIYQQFGLSMDDEDTEPMDDAAYEDYVRGLNVFSEDELKTLMDANAQIVKLSDEIDELTARHDASADETEQGVLDNLIHYKQDQITALADSVADLDARLRVAEENSYVMNLPGLTDEARQELISMYATQRDLEAQLAALEATLSDEALAQLYGEAG